MEGGRRIAADIFLPGAEPTGSILVLPLTGTRRRSTAAGLYITHSTPSNFTEASADIVTLAGMLQALLSERIVTLPHRDAWADILKVRVAGAYWLGTSTNRRPPPCPSTC